MKKGIKRFPKPSLFPQQADGVLRSASRRKSLIDKLDDAAELRGIKPNLAIKKYVEKRPWGGFVRLTNNEKTTVKILIIKPKQKFSLQYHKNRDEFWKVIDNPIKVTIGKRILKIKAGDEVFIPRKTLHRAEALSKTVHILEISFGKFNEKDIVRVEDDYGRV